MSWSDDLGELCDYFEKPAALSRPTTSPAGNSLGDLDWLENLLPTPRFSKRIGAETKREPSTERVQKNEPETQLPTCLKGMTRLTIADEKTPSRTFHYYGTGKVPKFATGLTDLLACEGLNYVKKNEKQFHAIARNMQISVKHRVSLLFCFSGNCISALIRFLVRLRMGNVTVWESFGREQVCTLFSLSPLSAFATRM